MKNLNSINYAFLTTLNFDIHEMQKDLEANIDKIKALTYSQTSTPFVLYVHTSDELTQEEITLIEQKVK